MCEKEIQLIAIICLFGFVCGTQNLVSSFDFQEGHLDNPVSTLLAVCSRQVVISSPLSRAIETSLLIFGEEAQPPRGSNQGGKVA